MKVKKIVAFAALFTVFLNQIIPSSFSEPISEQEAVLQPQTPVQDVPQAESLDLKGNVPPVAETTADFFMENALSQADESEDQEVRDVTEYSFDEAKEYLTPDYAAAVIVKSLTAENLKTLEALDIEVGIALIKGKIVLFTSGSKDEIRVLAPVKKLLENASLVAHTHPSGNAKPSFEDIQEAGENIEYVIGEGGIYAYNQDGLVQAEPLSYEEIASKIEKQQDPVTSTKETRDLLNEFIYLMDEYNEKKEEGVLFRSNHVEILPDPNLGFDDITPVPLTSQGVKPNLVNFASADGSTTALVLNTQAAGQMTYNGTGANSFGGAFFSYDNPGTQAQESINLATAFPQGIILALVSPFDSASEISLEVTDTSDARSSVTLAGIDTATRLWKILATDFDGVNTSQIKTISFVFHGQATNAKVSFNWGNFAFTPTIQPDLNKTPDDLTSLPGNPQPALLIAQPDANNFVSLSPSNRGTRLTYNTGSQSFVGGGFSFDDFNTQAIETQDLSGFNQLLFGLKGAPSQVKLEIIDDQGLKATFILTGISQNNEQIYVIPTTEIQNQGIDLNKVRLIYAIVEGQNQQGILDINHLPANFAISPDPNFNQASVTKLPLLSTGKKPELLGFASQDGSSAVVNKISTTLNTITYDGTDGNSFGGGFISYDDFSTSPQEEFINLQTQFPQGLIFGLNSPNSSVTEVIVELTPSSGLKDFVTLTGIQSGNQFWQVPLAAFNDIANLSSIQTITFLFKGQAANNQLRVNWGDFDFIPSLAPDPAKTAADISLLSGIKSLSAFDSNNPDPNGVVTLNQISTTRFNLSYDLTPGNSFGGGITSFDDFATNPAKETVNLTGQTIVLGLRDPGLPSRITVELEDATGAKDIIYLTGVDGTERFFSIAANLFEGVNLTQITGLNIVLEQAQVTDPTSALEVRLGTYPFIPSVPPDPNKTGADVTKLPLNSLNNRPDFNGFAKQDGSTATIERFSQSFVRVTYNGANTDSFGGGLITYDNPATNNLVESINFTNLFPQGFVFGLDDPNGTLTEVSLELTDATGAKDKVTLTGIAIGKKFWLVNLNLLDGVNLSQISAIAFVIAGQKVNTKLSVDWGDFNFIATTLPDPNLTPANITKLPLNGLNQRVNLNSFQSNDGSTATRLISSQDFARLTYTGTGAASFGGLSVNYDNDATVNTVEFINFSTLYPNGFVFEVDNNNTAVTDGFLQLRDNTGKTARINIGNIIGTGQRYKVLANQFFGIDVTKISEIVFGVEGQKNNVQLSLNLGEWQFTPTTLPDPNLTQADITKLPFNSLNTRVNLNNFQSNDGSTTTRTIFSQDFARLNYTGTGAASFGGYTVNYDDAATANTVEFINFSTLYAGGFVFEVDNNNTAVTDGFIQLRDNTGATSRINIGSIIGTGQRYKVLPNQFFGIDVTKISEIVFGVEGQKNNVQLSLNLGEWNFTPTTLPDPNLTPANITKLPLNGLNQRVNLNSFQSNDGSLATRQLFSHDFARLTYTGTGAASFGGFSVNYDNAATNNVVESINFSTLYPNGFVFEVDSPGGAFTGAFLQLRDDTGKTSRINIGNILATGQRYKVLPNQFFGIDVTKISEIVFGVEGQKNNAQLSLNLGQWEFTPSLNPDPTKTQANITKLPLTSLSEVPELVGFASLDGSTGNVVMLSQTVGQIQYTGSGVNSFGGAFINYDNPDTQPAKESINLATLFPNGIILGLNSPNSTVTSAIFEVTDTTGKTDQVILTGITSSAQRWLVPTGQFNDVNINAITTISIVLPGQAAGTQLNVDWGNFKFVPSLPSDPAKTLADISLLSGIRGLTSFDSDAPNPDAIFSLTQSSASLFSLTYNLTQEDSFGGTITTFDNFSTNTKEKVNLSGKTLVFGLRDGGVPSKVIVQLEDTNGKKDQVVLTGVNGTEKFYAVPVSLFDGINVERVTGIVFLLEEDNVTDPTSTLEVRFGNHKFTPPVAPNPSKDASDITLYSNVFHLQGFDSDAPGPDATLTLAQQSKTRFDLIYNVTPDGSFVGSITSFDDFGTAALENKDLRSQKIVLGLKDAGSPKVIVQLEDINGGRDQVILTGIDGTERFFEISTSLFDGVDLRNITGLIILVEEDRVTDPTSVLEVRLGNQPFIPSFPPDITKTAANVSLLASIQHLVSFDSNAPAPDGSAIVDILSSTRFNVNYNVSNVGSFGGSISSFDNFNTNATKENVSLSGQTLVIGLRDPSAPGKVVLQLEDDNGKKSKVYLTGVDGTERFFSIPTSQFNGGIDLTDITGIVLLIEQANVTDPTSTLEVRFGNQPFRGPFPPDPALTQANLTVLPTPKAAILTGGSNPGSSINRVNASRVDLNYTLAPNTFAGMTVNYDDFTTGTIENKDFTGFSELIVGLAGQPGDQVKVEIIDITGARNFIILGNLLVTEQFYHIPLALFTGVDLTDVRFINFIVDNTLVSSANGTIVVRVQPV